MYSKHNGDDMPCHYRQNTVWVDHWHEWVAKVNQLYAYAYTVTGSVPLQYNISNMH